MIDTTRRPEFLCGDCSTPNMVGTPSPGAGPDGGDSWLQVIEHDAACPRLAAMSKDERHEITDGGRVFHRAVRQARGGGR